MRGTTFSTIIGLALLLALAACGGSEGETTRPRIQDITEAVYASAVIQPADYYQVFPEVAGVVEERFVEAGDSIARGDQLFTIRNRTQDLQTANARLAYEEAQADLAGGASELIELQRQIDLARAQYRQDSLDYTRQRSLWDQNIGSRQQVDQRRLAFQSSETRYRNALDSYEQARRRLQTNAAQARNNLRMSAGTGEQFTVRSRLNGKVFNVNVEPGETVGPQQPLALIGSRDSFIVEMQIDEDDISRVRLGQDVYLSLDSYAGQVFRARVSKIYPTMDPQSQSFRVEAAFVEAPPVLYPNLTAEANVVLTTRRNALIIPRAYLLPGDSVLLADGVRRAVRTGIRDLSAVEITAGLADTSVVLLKPE